MTLFEENTILTFGIIAKILIQIENNHEIDKKDIESLKNYITNLNNISMHHHNAVLWK